jgi:hypothetical protein
VDFIAPVEVGVAASRRKTVVVDREIFDHYRHVFAQGTPAEGRRVVKAWESLDAGDILGAMRIVRAGADGFAPEEAALVVGRGPRRSAITSARTSASLKTGTTIQPP